jgi:hypoxanthine phosphoribosyltransferase
MERRPRLKQIAFSDICQRISTFPFPDVDWVAGIGEGGTVPAALIGYRLKRDVRIIPLNYRDAQNRPCRETPELIKPFDAFLPGHTVLLVDDASVTGQTMETAKKILNGYVVRTCVLKGRADHVLFPELDECVQWPWKMNHYELRITNYEL